ncbi:MAG: hypothetical protein JW863_08770, partial [Chitinispirillaceae bacterium]|nr:hypothetical protein [Chitinispirillaceae bacterium]
MNRILVLCMIGAAGFSLSAQTIAISGKVTNESGKGVKSAIVQLKSKNVADTTDADGAYTLAANITSVNNVTVMSGADRISLNNGVISVRLTKPEKVRMELFDMRGNLLESTLEKLTAAGTVQFDATKNRVAAGMMVIRVSIGERTSSFRFLPFANGQSAASASAVASSDGKLAKQLAVNDELEVSAAGYVTKKVPITSYEGTVNVTLAMENVGTCTASQKVN